MNWQTRKALFFAATLLVLAALPVSAELLYGLRAGFSIVRFDSATPGTISSVQIQGLQSGESIYSIDVRPADGRLYGISSTNRLYVIDPMTGAATQLGPAGAFTAGPAMDFDPQSDQLRLVRGQNQRVNPDDGTLIGTDAPVTPTSFLVEAAYDRNDTNSGSPTTLYGIDYTGTTTGSSYNLVRIGGLDGIPSASTGVATLIGATVLSGMFYPLVGFDISGLTGTAFMSVVEGVGNEAIESFTRLYSVNLATGQATLLGTVGSPGTALSGLTAASIPEPSTYALLLAGAGLLGLFRRRQRAPR